MSNQDARKPGEVTFTVLMLVGSAFLLWQSFGISGFQSWSSAGMFPMLAAATLLVTGLLTVRHLLRRPAAPDSGARAFFAQIAPLQLLGGVGAVAAYMLMLQPLGFLPSSLLFLFLSMRLFGSERWGLNLSVSVASLAAIHLVFSTVFSVVLPKGSWLVALLPI
ncbi:MAG: tripartite tricarboxylate transporter TctB family protein [Betaproteobacteria bacterium]|nr:tripartite tricarboxylate transporter TctB family protein [Betaproteobacteria bacterium]